MAHHRTSGAPYGVRPARPMSYLDFEKQKAAAAVAARRHYRGLTWLGRMRRAGGAPGLITMQSEKLSYLKEKETI